MARKKREWYPGATYHVMSRGNRRGAIFTEQGDYLYFLEHIAKIMERYPFKVHALCLMTNHFHMAVETENTELWKIMQKILSVYAEEYNHRTDEKSTDILKRASEKYGYSARVIHKLLRLARTSADLDGVEAIRPEDVVRALSCRDLDVSNSNMYAIK